MFTKSTIKAIQIIHFLSKRETEVTSIRDISNWLNLSLPYVNKLVSPLIKAKILKSERGCTGGLRLIKPLSEITYFDIQQLPFNSSDHFIEGKECIHTRRLTVHIEELLKNVTIDGAIKEGTTFDEMVMNAKVHGKTVPEINAELPLLV